MLPPTLATIVLSLERSWNMTKDFSFELTIRRENPDTPLKWEALYNGPPILGVCNEGDALEGLCVTAAWDHGFSSDNKYVTFSYNHSIHQPDTTGILVWNLPSTSSSTSISSAMHFEYKSGFNLATPRFAPGSSNVTPVSFDKEDFMGVSFPEGSTDHKYQWYICHSNSKSNGTLACALGNNTPKDPTCEKVKIQRTPSF